MIRNVARIAFVAVLLTASYGFREIDSDGIPSKVRSSYI
jgi:hypothetical protein